MAVLERTHNNPTIEREQENAIMSDNESDYEIEEDVEEEEEVTDLSNRYGIFII